MRSILCLFLVSIFIGIYSDNRISAAERTAIPAAPENASAAQKLLAEADWLCSKEPLLLAKDNCEEVLRLFPDSAEASDAEGLLKIAVQYWEQRDDIAQTLDSLKAVQASRVYMQAQAFQRGGTKQNLETAIFLYEEYGRHLPYSANWKEAAAGIAQCREALAILKETPAVNAVPSKGPEEELNRLRLEFDTLYQPAPPHAPRGLAAAELLHEANELISGGRVFALEKARNNCLAVLRSCAENDLVEEALFLLDNATYALVEPMQQEVDARMRLMEPPPGKGPVRAWDGILPQQGVASADTPDGQDNATLRTGPEGMAESSLNYAALRELLAEVNRMCGSDPMLLIKENCEKVLQLFPEGSESERARELLGWYKEPELPTAGSASSIREMLAANAQDMEEQAAVYQASKTPTGYGNAIFFYKKIGRLYPGTPSWKRAPVSLLLCKREQAALLNETKRHPSPKEQPAHGRNCGVMTDGEKKEKAAALLGDAQSLRIRGQRFAYEKAREHCLEIFRRDVLSDESEEALIWLNNITYAIAWGKSGYIWLKEREAKMPPPASPKESYPGFRAEPFDLRNSIVKDKSPEV